MVAAAVVAAGLGAAAIGASETSSAASDARSATQSGAATGRQALRQTTGAGIQDINSQTQKGVNTETAAGKAAVAGYKPYEALGTKATTELETLLGLKGGSGAALKALEATPGYQFAKQQGDQGTINAATATGMNLSGNTLEALSNYNEGLATNTFNSEVGNLEGAVNTGLSATSGAATAGLTAGGVVSGLEAGQGSQDAQLLSNEGTGIANVSIGQGTNDANISMAEAASQSALASSAGNDFMLAKMMKNQPTTTPS